MTVQQLLAEKRYALFPVFNRLDLLATWPELQKVESFMALNRKPKQLLFVYHYAAACSDSRLLETEEKRVEYAFKMAYGEDANDGTLKEWSDPGKWSQELLSAIADMRKFNFGIRVKNQLLYEAMQRKVERFINADWEELYDKTNDEVIHVPSDDDEEGGGFGIPRRNDVWQRRKDAMDIMKKALEILPIIQDRVETGATGVREVGEAGQEKRGQVVARVSGRERMEV